MEQTIIEGIKQALARGQTLQQAMESFYYAGYSKEDIENAARAFQGTQPASPQTSAQQTAPVKKLKTNTLFSKKPVQKVSNYEPAKPIQKLQPKQGQKVSGYQRQKTKPGIDWILILMLLGLFALIGVLLFMLLT